MAKTYNVLGMTCQGCANAVSNAIKKAVPDATIDVNLEGNAVTVESAGGAGGAEDDSIVKKAVEDAGFEYAGAA